MPQRADSTMKQAISDVLSNAAGWLTSRRWFGDKTQRIESISPVIDSLIELPGGVLALAIAEIVYGDGQSARYFVPLLATLDPSAQPEVGRFTIANLEWGVTDATTTSMFQRWFIERAASDASMSSQVQHWSWTTIGTGAARIAESSNRAAHLFGGEQSNTSIRFGRSVIIKLYRKLQPGINPDLEIGAFLAQHTNFPHTPTLLGELVMRDGETWSIGAVHAYQDNLGDGWSWLLALVATNDPSVSSVAREAFGLLGERTAQLHLALASGVDLEGFRPEPQSERTLAEFAANLRREISETIDLLRPTHGSGIDFAARSSHLLRTVADVEALSDTVNIRVHGDYHLGQVLRTTEGDFSILDFEGEPSRPIVDRRVKASALRDVAGMLRSFDYARATIERQVADQGTSPLLTDAWWQAARTVFLSRYVELVCTAPFALVPGTPESFLRALRLLELQKALYEVRYELNNRPNWVEIPLRAILATT